MTKRLLRGVSVGINMGTTAVTTVVTHLDKNGKFSVLGFGSHPAQGMRRGAVYDAESAADALRRSVHEASRSSGVAVRRAFFSIGGSHINSFTVRGAIAASRADGEITDDDVRRVIQAAEGMIPRNPNREVIHLIPREFKVDGEAGIADPIGMVGMKLEVEAMIVDGARPAMRNLARCCELARVEVENWAAAVLAASEVLLTKKQKELGVILLDLGAGTSDFAVFEEGKIIDVGSFPIGGGHITSDIAIGFRTPVSAAEEIKVRYAEVAVGDKVNRRENIAIGDFVHGDESVYAVRDLTDIVAARLTDIFELTTKALRRVGRAGLLPGGVVLTGGAAEMPGIQDLARRELRLPVEVAKNITMDGMEDVLPVRFAVPLGLILWEMRRGGDGFPRGSGALYGFWEGLKSVLRSFVP